MKKILLLLITVCFTVSGWGQISEYTDPNFNNGIEFGSGQDPELIELNGKMYFIADLGSTNGSEFILSIDQNNDVTLEYDPAAGFSTDQYDIQALTVYNNQLHFALANQTTAPGNYFLYRLNAGIGEPVSVSALISDPYSSRMIVYNDVLYFAGRENASVPEVGLISYSTSQGINQVNTTTPSEDFSPTRFIVGANNTLYFFEEDTDFPSKQYLLYNLDTNSGSTILSTIGPIWYGDSFNAPVVSVFGDKLIIISNIASNGTGGVYQLSSSNVLSSINALIGVSSNSFRNQVNYNNGGVVYNNQLAIFRASNSTVNTTDFVDDRLVLLAGDGSFTEYELPNLDGAGFYGVENDALIFFATESGAEKIYELRETTNNVLPTVRALLPSSTQDISPLFGKTYNNRLYYYGNPVNSADGSLRTLNFYDPKILNYDLTLNNQDNVDFLGSLDFEQIVGLQLSIQDDTSFNGGTPIGSLALLNSLKQIPSTVISDTQLSNLSGFENLESIADIEIFNNLILANFCALQSWASNNPGSSSDWIVNGNAYNPTFSQLQSTATCSITLSPCQTDIVLGSQEEVDALIAEISADGCNTFEGAKLSVNNNAGGTQITDLSGLSAITSNTQTTEISISNTNLLSLDGIQGFLGNTNISISISGNDSLNDISALSSISTVLSLEIFDTNLSDLSGVSNLETVTDIFYILGNTNLTSLNGLENLLNVNNSLIIEQNSNLINYCAIQPRAAANTAFANALTILNNGYNPTIAQVQNSNTCSFTCTPVNFADANLKAFFLDPGNSSRILDSNGVSVTGLVIGGEVCTEKAIEVFEINLDGGYNNTPITSLGGLEDFTNLGRLNIGGAQLTGSVDLSTLVNLEEFEGTGNEITSLTASSANSKLTRIEVSFQGTNEDVLTAVNLNGASIPLLESLSLQNNRNLTAIDLTQTPNLSSLRPDNTAITKLDLTAITDLNGFDTTYFKDEEGDGALQEIDLRNNLGNFDVAAFSLDATGHPNLTCVLVNQTDLATAQNNVTNATWIFDSADVVRTSCPVCTPITFVDTNLKSFFLDPGNASRILDVNGSPVTGLIAGGEVCVEKAIEVYEVNLSGGHNNTLIGSIADLEAFTNLRVLQISDAQLTGDVDLSPLANLSVFEGSGNEIASLTASGSNSQLTRIDVSFQGANKNVLLSVTLSGILPQLTSLSLQNNRNLAAIDLTQTPILSNLRPDNTAITKLDLTAITDLDAFDTTYFKDEEGDGILQEIDLRNNLGNFDVASFQLDATGHPFLRCVLVNQTDLATAQNNVTNVTWIFDRTDVVKTECDTISDMDNDGIADSEDNCPIISNADQADLDNDDLGDVCDTDLDGDGVDNDVDACPEDPTETEDNDGDGICDNADNDDDNDGVLDSDDLCPLEAGPASDDGCPTDIFIDQEDILVIVLNETCAGQNNGSIEIIIENEDFTYNLFLDGTAVGTADFDNSLIINDLADGSYQICARVDALPDYEQCFGININTYDRLSIDSKGIDALNLTARFEVAGSNSYEILVNDVTYNFEFASKDKRTLLVPLDKGQNKVTITGESVCQGIYTDTIIIGNISIYPNPVTEMLNFDGFEAQGSADILIYSVGGRFVKQVTMDLINGSLRISFEELPNGLYIVKAITNKETIEFKIIKK